LYEALEKKTAGCVRSNISNASHLSQTVLLNSMRDPKNMAERQEKFNTLKLRALKVKEVLADAKYQRAWDVYPFNSGYFMCLELKTVDAERLRVHLLDRYGVGLISLGSRQLRVAFSCIDADQIQELFDTILQGVKDLEAMT
jgi:aspartate/methionine/tyrosine aminotransferase